MKRKAQRSLALNKTTVRILGARQLGRAAGGATQTTGECESTTTLEVCSSSAVSVEYCSDGNCVPFTHVCPPNTF